VEGRRLRIIDAARLHDIVGLGSSID